MTMPELTQAAVDCLKKAFHGEDVPVHVVQAAISILHLEASMKAAPK